jgi:hypothetical protein
MSLNAQKNIQVITFPLNTHRKSAGLAYHTMDMPDQRIDRETFGGVPKRDPPVWESTDD